MRHIHLTQPDQVAQRFGHRLAVTLGDERAALLALSDLDDPDQFQRSIRFAYRRPSHAQHLGCLALRRKPISWTVFT